MTLFRLKRAKNEKLSKFGKVALTNFLIEKTFLFTATLNLIISVFVYNFDFKSSLLMKLKAFTGFIAKNLEENILLSRRVNKDYSTEFKLQNASERFTSNSNKLHLRVNF